MIELVILFLYAFSLCCILLYCLAESMLAFKYVWHKKYDKIIPPKLLPDNLSPKQYPMVTVQLPIFNELYVVDRLIDAVCAFDYPKTRLEIQVLDDSTDETLAISQAKVKAYADKGFLITLKHRTDRSGYKAGALQEALTEAKGEYIAIFDADFIPNPDFLKQTLPYFDKKEIGVVQTRWEHINKDYSFLTRIQAFFLDVHFTVEQGGRNASGYFMNFNGTAGVWRKTTIYDAGGWQADTLTEDLDLSYRAQMKGWQFKYLENIGAPSELPADMQAFKSQQFRWIKGGAEVARKVLPRIAKTDLPFAVKFNAFSHLLSSSVYIVVFLTAVLSVPLMLVKNSYIDFNYLQYSYVFFLSNFAIAYVYFVATKYREKDKIKVWTKFIVLLPSFMIIALGMSLHNASAAVRGLLREDTPFVRTPKFAITSLGDKWKNKRYASKKIDGVTFMEGIFALYFLAAIIYGIYYQKTDLMLLHVLAMLGFSVTFLYSILHAK